MIVNVGEYFAKVQRAKDVLTDDQQRKKYDTWRNSGIAMSYDQWCAMRDSVHTVSMTHNSGFSIL